MSATSPRWLLLLALGACTASSDKPGTDTDATTDTDPVGTDTDPDADTDVAGDTDVATCDVVPTCTGFGALPTAPTYLDDPGNVTATDQGPACGDPKLLIALRDISVRAAQDDISGDVIYCVTQVESAAGSEIRVTTPTPALNEGDSVSLPLTDGILWGDVLTPRLASASMLITVDCLESDDPAEYDSFVTALTNAATELGATQNAKLWSFPADKPITGILAATLTANSDDLLFDAQVMLPKEDLLALAAGARWTVRRSGVASLSEWDWEVGLLVWGCSDSGD
jgi:hypothetical protein